MLEGSWALEFAQEWIASWNSHDLDRILSHYHEDFQMSSPLIVERLGREDGVLKGKTAVGEYWQPSMSLAPPLRFELLDVLIGINRMTIYYRNVGRKIVAETLTFDNARKVISGASQWSVMSSVEE
ncbi:MAG: nuclear transport factor 2 family protein [Dehalococcoidia bacterium]